MDNNSLFPWQIAVQVILALISFIGLFMSFNASLESKINNLRTELKSDIEKIGIKVESLGLNQARLEQRMEHLEEKVGQLDHSIRERPRG